MTLRLLCDAIPFCYGPGAALETFLRALNEISTCRPEIDVLATGTTRELLERARLPVRLLSVDSEDEQALRGFPFASYDAFFNVCNPVSYQHAHAQGLRTVYLDFLLWMHTGPRPPYFGADLYLAENYPGTTEWIAQRGSEIDNLMLIPPLITPAERRPPHDGSLLIGLGGLYSRLTVPGKNTNYAPFVVRTILDAIPRRRFSRVTIAGPAGLPPLLADVLEEHPYAEYASMSHEQFLRALGECDAFVSHPGLYAAFEAMLGGVPSAFLPPSNYTQILQLRHFRACGLAEWSFAWEDAGLPAVPAGLAEADGVREVLKVIERAECSSAAPQQLSAMLTKFFDLPQSSLRAWGERQRSVASRFGVDGPRVAARRLAQWFLQPVEIRA